MHALANPARFLRIARPATLWLLLIGLVLAGAGMIAGLTLTPPDYLQGDTVRILYIHVPAAWLGMAGWMGIAGASISQLVWRHPLAAIAGRAVAPAGATFAAICLITGSIWGRPTWGTWWEWDGRLTSMLILFFLYLGYIGLASAERERGGEGRIAALRAPIVAGGANNQLATSEDGQRLHARNILYAPDYVINAGGIINVCTEYLGDGDASLVRQRIEGIPVRLEQVWAESHASGRDPAAVADGMAHRLIGRA